MQTNNNLQNKTKKNIINLSQKVVFREIKSMAAAALRCVRGMQLLPESKLH